MRRLIPHPLLFLALLFMWLVLNAFTPGHLILGALVALAAGRAFVLLEPARPQLGSPVAMARLAAIVTRDILLSNVHVAARVLGLRRAERHHAFVEVPLRLRDPLPLAILAIIITATPGTLWVDYDPETGLLLTHVYDLADADEWRATVRDRYEALLLEIFP